MGNCYVSVMHTCTGFQGPNFFITGYCNNWSLTYHIILGL